MPQHILTELRSPAGKTTIDAFTEDRAYSASQYQPVEHARSVVGATASLLHYFEFGGLCCLRTAADKYGVLSRLDDAPTFGVDKR